MSHCEFSGEADTDLIEIGDYIARGSPRNAVRFVRRIRERCVELAETPLMGRARPEVGEDYRSIPFRGTPCVIVYRPINNGVEILRMRHGRRNLPGAGD